MAGRFQPVLLLLLTLLLVGCGREEKAVVPQAQPVRVVTVGAPPRPEPVEVVGRVAGKEELQLAFKVGGIIQQIGVEPGQVVKAGQLLAALDTTEIDAQVRSAAAQADKAARDLVRAEELARKGVVSTQALQDARSAQQSAQAALDAARFNQVHARILAPSEGVILARLAEARETVAAGLPVLSMSRADSGWILRVGLPDRQAVQVRAGDAATVTLDALPGQSMVGTVTQVGAASDWQTGTVAAEIQLQPAGAPLVSGWIGRASIQAGSQQAGAVLVVPVSAILEAEGPKAHVFVLDPASQRVHRRDVAVGQLLVQGVAVLDGLEVGQQVVSEGAAWLQDGDAVRVMP